MSLAAVWEHIPFFLFWWLCADLLISIILCFQMWVKASGDRERGRQDTTVCTDAHTHGSAGLVAPLLSPD